MEHVYEYCARQNRPFNATNLADALQKEGIKKAAAQRYLDTLVSDNRLSLTERGKTKVYFAIQPENVLPKEKINEMEHAVKTKQEQILTKKQELQSKRKELMQQKNQISVKEIREETTKMTKENGEIVNKMKPFKEKLMAQQQQQQKDAEDSSKMGGKDALKDAMKTQKEIEKKFVTYCETWLKRKRAFRDITATIVEGSNVKMKDLMKQLEIETDEANEVDEKEFRSLLDELKKKMRAEEIRKMNKKRKATA